MKSGMFIALEGIDGAGTTTQARRLSEWFAARALPAFATFEPSAGRIGRLIREYLAGKVDAPDVDRHFHTLALLFAADRLDHLAREVEPRLGSGIHVVSDRYLLSSLVYQSLHCAPDWVAAINGEAPPPSLTLLLDLPAESAMERLARRGLFEPAEIYETIEQQAKLRERYLEAARRLSLSQDIVVIDGSGEPAAVGAQIAAQVERRLKNREG
jgi:dTMP kinase